MGLNKDFPKDPYKILHPDIRWFPGDEVLDEKIREKLLPPLVDKIRKDVFKWRQQDYPNISDCTKSLLTYWFKTEHLNDFQYYFAQRESVETIIFLYECEEIRHLTELLKYDSSSMLVNSSFKENWLRLIIKQATGTGKTKVLALLITWCYFHKQFNQDSELSQNFLLLAPNTIVLDRLKDDIENLNIFKTDPIIPPHNYAGRNWVFNPTVHIQDNISNLSNQGNIFLTNIQRFARRKKDEDIPINYFLGPRPVTNTTDNKISVKDIVNNIDNLIILNDEAHHIHDSRLAWNKTIEIIHSNLMQKGSKLPLQLDVTATPKDQSGKIFVQTVADYPLVEAIHQEVVKKPVVPDEVSRGKLNEKCSSKFSERFRDYIDLGVTVWLKDYKNHQKLDKKALLFIMVDDTKNCDDVKEYLESHYLDLKGSTFVIHTNKEGSFEVNTSSKNQKELQELRQTANKVDEADNNIKAIVSVLMLKEGWDVKNVTTIIGLRPYSTKANILPEQTLGRGLRRMYFGQNKDEELNVVGTDAFLDFVESIKSEGIILEKRPMSRDSEPSGPTIIEIDKNKDIEKLDIKIPILSPRISRQYRNLEELDIDKFDFKSIKLKQFSSQDQKNILFKELVTEEIAKEIQMDYDFSFDKTLIIRFFTQSIMRDLRLIGGHDILYEKLKQFLENRLFGETVDLEDSNVVRNLSENDVRNLIKETFKKYINQLTITDKGVTEIQNYIKISDTKPFSVSRTDTYLLSCKSLFNKIVGDSKFEIEFANFLESATDVQKFIKNYIQIGFKLDYQNHEGNISNYYPDFIVHLKNQTVFIIETKGAESLDDPLKIKRLKIWCQDINSITNQFHRALYIRQEKWNNLGHIPNSFQEIINTFII